MDVRFHLLDCILLWAAPSDGHDISEAVRLIDDPEKPVRWKAMEFLSRASTGQLESAVQFLEKWEPASPNLAGLRLLLSGDRHRAETIEQELQSPDPRMRRYAAVAVKRRLINRTDANGRTITFSSELSPMPAENRRLLLASASSDDPEISGFIIDNVADQATKDNTPQPGPFSSLALRYSLDHKPEEAIKTYQQAIRMRSESDTGLYFDYLELAAEYGELNRTTEEIDAYKRAVAFRPRIPYGHLRLGMAYVKLGDKKSATEEYNILNDLDPELANNLREEIDKLPNKWTGNR